MPPKDKKKADSRFDKYYKTLGLKTSAGPKEIQETCRQLGMQWHPGKNPSPEAVGKFKEVVLAYKKLLLYPESDPGDERVTENDLISMFEMMVFGLVSADNDHQKWWTSDKKGELAPENRVWCRDCKDWHPDGEVAEFLEQDAPDAFPLEGDEDDKKEKKSKGQKKKERKKRAAAAKAEGEEDDDEGDEKKVKEPAVVEKTKSAQEVAEEEKKKQKEEARKKKEEEKKKQEAEEREKKKQEKEREKQLKREREEKLRKEAEDRLKEKLEKEKQAIREREEKAKELMREMEAAKVAKEEEERRLEAEAAEEKEKKKNKKKNKKKKNNEEELSEGMAKESGGSGATTPLTTQNPFDIPENIDIPSGAGTATHSPEKDSEKNNSSSTEAKKGMSVELKNLIDMGFPADKASIALANAPNVNSAIELLLSGRMANINVSGRPAIPSVGSQIPIVSASIAAPAPVKTAVPAATPAISTPAPAQAQPAQQNAPAGKKANSASAVFEALLASGFRVEDHVRYVPGSKDVQFSNLHSLDNDRLFMVNKFMYERNMGIDLKYYGPSLMIADTKLRIRQPADNNMLLKNGRLQYKQPAPHAGNTKAQANVGNVPSGGGADVWGGKAGANQGGNSRDQAKAVQVSALQHGWSALKDAGNKRPIQANAASSSPTGSEGSNISIPVSAGMARQAPGLAFGEGAPGVVNFNAGVLGVESHNASKNAANPQMQLRRDGAGSKPPGLAMGGGGLGLGLNNPLGIDIGGPLGGLHAAGPGQMPLSSGSGDRMPSSADRAGKKAPQPEELEEIFPWMNVGETQSPERMAGISSAPSNVQSPKGVSALMTPDDLSLNGIDREYVPEPWMPKMDAGHGDSGVGGVGGLWKGMRSGSGASEEGSKEAEWAKMQQQTSWLSADLPPGVGDVLEEDSSAKSGHGSTMPPGLGGGLGAFGGLAASGQQTGIQNQASGDMWQPLGGFGGFGSTWTGVPGAGAAAPGAPGAPGSGLNASSRNKNIWN